MQILHTPLTPARLPHWRQPEEGPVIRMLLNVFRRRRGGGSMPSRPLGADEVPAILSPGSVSPEVRRYLSQEDIDRINAPRRP